MAKSAEISTKTAITPRRNEDFPEWYQQVIRAAELAEPSDVRGCMVIRPWGYGIWENMQRQLDAMFRATGHRNAYFPLFIPLSYFAKEAEHVEGFAKECAVVTHSRLEADADGKLGPASALTEPLVVRPKSESERFPGAVQTLTLEAMAQDRKAIQAGTSHFLGQNFSRASGIQFQNREGQQEFGWTTSWGMTTRLVGTIVMTHGDDDGLVLPPRIAPTQIVILPITPKEETRAAVMESCDKLAKELRETRYVDLAIEVEVDRRDLGGGIKNWEWIKKGVPLRIEIGPRDLASGNVMVSRRDQPVKSKELISTRELRSRASELLASIRQNPFERAKEFRDEHTRVINSKTEFYDFFTPKNAAKPEIHGGFALAHWNGLGEVEAQIKNDLKVTIRVIPLDDSSEPGSCIFTGEPSRRRVIWAKSY